LDDISVETEGVTLAGTL